ncbi:enoyl-CoA hydratase [Oscillibacter sp. PC13]|uniref:enoyl-CoA hydratase-related protein n=1 Tax=Oscillibacter sp. PC13 TaxID=1855299 RepID=UPI0008E4D996|nr:enoyl-CoA hydratase-related protein [Oscillibacter sp. PC13]SFP70262.1 enoyl-CoA hydratase [Oscillibacter sp. PC13]
MNNIKLEVANGIALVTIDRPKAPNALNSETLTELKNCFAELEGRKDVRVVLLTGSREKAFVAGADISEMVNTEPAAGRAMALLADEAFSRLEKMPQVTIAAVNGYALGGGCELAMACDIRVAAESAVLGQPECGLEILPGFGGTQRLARLVGKGRAKELSFTCDRIDAQEAHRIGLVNKVVAKDALLAECRSMAERILSKGSYAISLAKASIESGMDTDLASGLELEAINFGLSFATHDKKEGMTAFLEKRPAQLTDF